MTDDGETGDSGGETPRLAAQREIESVYQPAEDSRLLADAVVEQIESGMLTVASDALGLDVGTGSGYVAHRVRSETGLSMIGVDINPEACLQARQAGVPVVRGDMFDPFRSDVFDVILCNPPYLPTPPDQEWDDWMERALSGGPDGRAVVDPFLEGVGRVLHTDGYAFLLISTLTGPEEVREFAKEQGLDSSIVAEESHPFEKLLVVRLTPR